MSTSSTGKGIRSLFGWRGLAQDVSKAARHAAISLLAVSVCSMVATQTNYFVVGDAHLIAVLAPITACALLYGPMPATIVGFIAGLAEMIHATLLPLDIYEMYFIAPSNSVVLFGFMGLFMGLMYALSRHRTFSEHWKAVLALLISCAIGSIVFTVYFTVSTGILNALYNHEIPHEIIKDLQGNKEVFSQILANFGLMAGLTLAAAEFNRIRMERGQVRALRETFQGWLAVVMTVAYLVTAGLCYTGVSAACRNSAERQMQGQVDYLTGQLAEKDRLIEGLGRRTNLTPAKLEELHESSIGGVTNGLPTVEGGIAAVAEDDVIVSSNEPSYIGASFKETVGAGLTYGFDESLYSQTRSSQWYMGSGKLGYLRAAQIGYVRISRSGNYEVMTALPASEVFTWRPWLMAVASVIFLALFIVIYTQASLLLKNVVVRNIDETNDALSRIIAGNLDQQVLVREPLEFARLSSGINATVDSLKDAIAAEAARIERDLSTAKAIQESALPRTFPPFPEIEAFDIYASMTAAREVGGDFYDFFLVDNTTLGFLIADVSGKGIPAALFMMAAKTELANYIGSGMELAEAVQTSNWHLCQSNDAGMFVTVWAATLNWETGKLTYVNAGHNPPLLRHKGSWQWLRTKGGLFLGTFDSATYRSTTITLETGDQLLLYTDGVNEAFDVDEKQYGDERLERFLADHADLHPHPLVNELKADVHAWAGEAEQSDDITMLALEYGTPPEVGASITVPATIDRLEDILFLIHSELAQRLCPIAVQNRLDVAIEELFVNVCNYAYQGQEQPGKCRVDYVFNAHPSTITIQLTDWGAPFDPLQRKDPTMPSSIQDAQIGGLGILMARRMTDDMSYLRDGDANVLAFKKSW